LETVLLVAVIVAFAVVALRFLDWLFGHRSKRPAPPPQPRRPPDEVWVPPRREPSQRHVFSSRSVASRSSAAPAAPVAVAPLTAGMNYRMEYGDVDGVVTDRLVRVQGAALEYGLGYLRAYCHLRGAQRTFRGDRILALREDGGAMVARPAEAVAQLARLMGEKDPEHDRVMSRVRGGLNALIWIAQSDRDVTVDEAEILMDFIAARNGLAGAAYATVPWRQDRAAAYIDDARPTFATAMGALAKMSRSGKEFKLMEDFAERLVACGGAGAANRRRQLFPG
jgi:hypothetical protein